MSSSDKQSNLFHKLFHYIKSRYTLPEEAKEHVAKRNARLVSYVLYALMLFGASCFIVTCISRRQIIGPYIYYSGMFLVASISLICLKLFCRKNSYFGIQTVIVIFLCFQLSLLLSNFLFSGMYSSGLIAVYIFYLLVVICLDVNPFFHFLYILTFAVAFGIYFKNHNIYKAVMVNNCLFCLCIAVLSMYKRSSLVKRNVQRQKIREQNRYLEANNIELEHQKDALLINKKILEDYALTQAERLNLQNERIIRIQNNTIVSLSNLVENRDEDTGDHVLRTRDYVEVIAIKALLAGQFPELNEEVIKLIMKAAPMHDIGKIVVPDSVLKKPGKLTPEEFEMIKLHTTKGGEIVEDVLGSAEDEDYVRIAKEIATSHHEKYDGSGYPYGLAGEAIPLSARIMAIADVFDALVSPRCYKSPFPVDDAFMIIKESAGTHFDPVLAQLFVDAKDEIIEIYNKYV